MVAKPSLKYETIDQETMKIMHKYNLDDFELYSKVYDAIFEAVEFGFDQAVKRGTENFMELMFKE